MAKVEYEYPIHEMHGKTQKQTNVSYRGGYTYTLEHPRGEAQFSEKEKAYHQTFGVLNKEASRIHHDGTMRDEYNDWKEKGYKSRFRYILARLIASLK